MLQKGTVIEQYHACVWLWTYYTCSFGFKVKHGYEDCIMVSTNVILCFCLGMTGLMYGFGGLVIPVDLVLSLKLDMKIVVWFRHI